MDPALLSIILSAGAYTLWVLLPLVPAVLIYWLFPSTAVAVSGPFANLTVRASGAFAAYLIVFSGTYIPLQKINEHIDGLQRQFWTVKGQVRLADSKGSSVLSEELLRKLEISTNPEAHSLGKYQIKLRLFEERDGLPVTVLRVPGFGEQLIDWKLAQTNRYRRTIEFKNPITFIRDTSTTAPVTAVLPRLDLAAGDSSVKPDSSAN
jgi:hypothetical protein